MFAGLCSGLTVGYLSIEELNLELKLKNGTENEKKLVFDLFFQNIEIINKILVYKKIRHLEFCQFYKNIIFY